MTSKASRERAPSRPELAAMFRQAPCTGGCGKILEHLGRPRTCDDCGRRSHEDDELLRLEVEKAHQVHRLREIRQNISHHLARSGVPTRYRAYTRETWEAKYSSWTKTRTESDAGEALDFAKIAEIWLRQDDPNGDWLLTLYGTNGVRKTSFGTSILGESICNGHQCRWVDAETWIRRLEYGFERPGAHDPLWMSTAALFQMTSRVPRLMLDDLASIRGARAGYANSGDWWKEQIADLIRYREMECLPTIYTANFEDLEELRAINKTLPSRMTNTRLAFKIEGEDQRRN